jgi:hypothetical protein
MIRSQVQMAAAASTRDEAENTQGEEGSTPGEAAVRNLSQEVVPKGEAGGKSPTCDRSEGQGDTEACMSEGGQRGSHVGSEEEEDGHSLGEAEAAAGRGEVDHHRSRCSHEADRKAECGSSPRLPKPE